MMSTRALAVFMVCLAASATFVSAIGFTEVLDVDRDFGHEEQLNETEEEFQEPGADGGGDQDSIGAIASFFLGAFNLFQTLSNLLFYFPQVLSNLGLPFEAAVFVSAPIYIVVGIAAMEFLRGGALR